MQVRLRLLILVPNNPIFFVFRYVRKLAAFEPFLHYLWILMPYIVQNFPTILLRPRVSTRYCQWYTYTGLFLSCWFTSLAGETGAQRKLQSLMRWNVTNNFCPLKFVRAGLHMGLTHCCQLHPLSLKSLCHVMFPLWLVAFSCFHCSWFLPVL